MAPATPKKTTKASPSGASFKIPLYQIEGKEVTSIQVPGEIFGAEGNKNLLSQYVYIYNTNQRQGNVSAKTRAEVIGTTKKMYRQKGTGRARHGTKKVSLFVGGGVTFGPKPREFSLSMNKKQKKKALFYSLALAYKAGGVAALAGDSLKVKPKTSVFAAFLKQNKLDNKKTLIVLDKLAKNNLILASRNVPGVSVTDVQSLNAYAVMKAQSLLFVEPSIAQLSTHFLKKA